MTKYMGENEVVSKDDDVELARPSAEVDMSDDDVEEQFVKRRKRLQTSSASEIVDRRSGLRTR